MLGLSIALLCCVCTTSAPLRGEDLATDANLITGIDISDSVSQEMLRMELEGMARAVTSDEFLSVVGSGHHGRIGFAVFAWHHYSFPQIVEWTTISNAAEAQAVALRIVQRLQVDVEAEARGQAPSRFGDAPFYAGRLTDISGALTHATQRLAEAPYATARAVINIIGEGSDNVGEGPARARDRATEQGITVNGVVVGGDRAMLDYYRQEVSGGAGSFVIAVAPGDTMVPAMTRKFINDIIAMADP
jgi:hypothetical protein